MNNKKQSSPQEIFLEEDLSSEGERNDSANEGDDEGHSSSETDEEANRAADYL